MEVILLKRKAKILSALLCIVLIATALIVFDNNSIETTSFDYSSEKVPSDFNGFRIVHISDLHNKRFGKNQSRLIEKIKSLAPDIIVFTGDLVSRKAKKVDNAESFIRQAADICPVYYVEGNHERYCALYVAYFRPFLESVGVHTLKNKSEKIFINGSYVTICGVRDYVDVTEFGYEVSQRDEVFRVWLKDVLDTGDDSFKILLSHRPEWFEEYADNSADLVFCGHAHGGQVILPFVGGVCAPDQGMFPKYYSGEYNLGGSTMFVSRGLGNSIFFPRINNRPEIICVTLNHK